VFIKKHSDCQWLIIERLSFAASSMWSVIMLMKTAAKFSSEGYWPTCSICLTYLSFVKHRTSNQSHLGHKQKSTVCCACDVDFL